MSEIRFTLYVAGATPRSEQAIANLRHLGETQFGGDYQLAIIDVTEDPEAAETRRILTTPTLIKESPSPVRRITGDLSDPDKVLVGLALGRGGTEHARIED